jgi:RHS repeat-associated protein
LTKTGSVINYTYTATGEKLAKRIYSNYTTIGKRTWYIGNMVFEENFAGQTGTGPLALQYISLEEGKLRIIDHKTAVPLPTPTEEIYGGITMPDGRFGVYDYYIKDQQGNTRMVLTEEKHRRFDYCSMEYGGSNQTYEQNEFGKATGTNSEVYITRSDKPLEWTANSSLQVAKLGGPGGNFKKIGPNKLIKVMAGDRLDMVVDYYIRPNPTVSPAPGIVSDLANLIASVVGANSGTTSSSHSFNTDPIKVPGTNNTFGNINTLLNNQPNNINMPKAYLTWLFFDENFNLVDYEPLGSYSQQVQNSGGDQISKAGIKVPKNGYAFIYLSNETETEYVYFDNLAINHTRAKILEETHYYPYGMRIQPISAIAFQKPDAKEKYQGEFSSFEEESGLNEFELRNYDPKIGRWTGVDPYDEFASGYVGMGNDPINFTDPSGGGIGDAPPEVFCIGSKALVGKMASMGILLKMAPTMITAVRTLYQWSNKANGIAFTTTEFPKDGVMNFNGQEMDYDGVQSQEVFTPNEGAAESYSTPNPFISPSGSLTIGQILSMPAPATPVKRGFMSQEDRVFMQELIGNNPDGSQRDPSPLDRLAKNKTFQNFSNNLALPMVEMAAGDGIVKGVFAGVGLVFKSGGSNVVYQGFDKVTGAVKYVGITKRNPLIRFGEHELALGTGREFLRYSVVPGATNLNRINARIWEQTLINKHGLDNLLNIRNSIAPKYWLLHGIKP